MPSIRNNNFYGCAIENDRSQPNTLSKSKQRRGPLCYLRSNSLHIAISSIDFVQLNTDRYRYSGLRKRQSTVFIGPNCDTDPKTKAFRIHFISLSTIYMILVVVAPNLSYGLQLLPMSWKLVATTIGMWSIIQAAAAATGELSNPS